MMWSTNVENMLSLRNSFGVGPHFCQQNKHISLKKMIIRTTCKAVDCFSNVARVSYLIVTSHLHLHIHLFLLRWWSLCRHHTSQIARKVRRLYEGCHSAVSMLYLFCIRSAFFTNRYLWHEYSSFLLQLFAPHTVYHKIPVCELIRHFPSFPR